MAESLKFFERVPTFVLIGTTVFLLSTAGKEESRADGYGDRLFSGNFADEDDETDLNFSTSEETSGRTTNPVFQTKNSDSCSEDRIMLHLARIGVINPETILRIAFYENLHSVCRKIGMALVSVDNWAAGCDPLPANTLYARLTEGVRLLENKICAPSDYLIAFEKYASCYRELRNEFLDCSGPADWIVNMENEDLCGQYKIIADCYFAQTAMLCGTNAAKNLKELVTGVINAVISTDCPEVRKNPAIEDPMPEWRAIHAGGSRSPEVAADSTLRLLSGIAVTLFLCARLR